MRVFPKAGLVRVDARAVGVRASLQQVRDDVGAAVLGGVEEEWPSVFVDFVRILALRGYVGVKVAVQRGIDDAPRDDHVDNPGSARAPRAPLTAVCAIHVCVVLNFE